MRRRFAALVAVMLAIAITTPLLLVHADSGFDQTLFAATNGDRANSCGRPQLGWSNAMAAIAEQRAQYIADTGDITNHLEQNPGAENTGQSWNVPDATQAANYINQAYMASGEHRANICDGRWNVVGIASVYRDSWQGHSQVWIDAVEFTSSSSAPAPAAPQAPPNSQSGPSVPQSQGGVSVPGTGGAQ